MKERPIIFSGPMVRAILAGKKTQTRRVCKLRDKTATYSGFNDLEDEGPIGWPMSVDECGDWHLDRCPFGDVGDRLWVKETFVELRRNHYHEVGPRDRLADYNGFPKRNGFEYKANSTGPNSERCRAELGYTWKSPIYMPRLASRITLQIVNLRVERLQAITEADAMAEGCPGENCVNHPTLGLCTDDGLLPSEQYRELWEQINGKTPHTWTANPWVWVIEFRRVAA